MPTRSRHVRLLALLLVLSCASLTQAAAPPPRDPDLPPRARLRLGMVRCRVASPALGRYPYRQSIFDPPVLSADRRLIATAPEEVIEVFDTRTGRRLFRLEEKDVAFMPLAFSRDGKTLAVATHTDKKAGLALWPLAKGARPKGLAFRVRFALDRTPVAA